MKYYLFPKFVRHLSVEGLMEYCASVSLAGPDVLIRNGYWVQADMLEALPPFVRAARAAGLEVKTATTDLGLAQLTADDCPLRALAAEGIETVRAGFVARSDFPDPRTIHDRVRAMLEQAAEVARRAGIRLVLQLHGGCYPHSATAAWFLVKGLDPRSVGVMIDPGNNVTQEGTEAFEYQVPLLKEYLAAVGAKDGGLVLRRRRRRRGQGLAIGVAARLRGADQLASRLS